MNDVGPRGDLRVEAAPVDGEGEGALHLVARPHAARADDALRRVEGEVRVGGVARSVEVVGPGVDPGAVADLAQPDDAGHVLQLAVAVGGAGQAVERVVGDVQLHDAAAQPREPRRSGCARPSRR